LTLWSIGAGWVGRSDRQEKYWDGRAAEDLAYDGCPTGRAVLRPAQDDKIGPSFAAHLSHSGPDRAGTHLNAGGVRAVAGEKLGPEQVHIADGVVEYAGQGVLGEHVKDDQLDVAVEQREQRFQDGPGRCPRPFEGHEQAPDGAGRAADRIGWDDDNRFVGLLEHVPGGETYRTAAVRCGACAQHRYEDASLSDGGQKSRTDRTGEESKWDLASSVENLGRLGRVVLNVDRLDEGAR
jgi:hypothetical protein